ncbi:MAG: RlmE family RNA methyltransferase [Deltaproteobacteria bacterium]|nr:RlmE family RNA methyltransferase [Deltaproteobacteria bacterium]
MGSGSQQKNRWADHFTLQARKEQYPARSVYKLQEIQGKYQIIKKGHRILDLGCAPGSWLLYAAKQTGKGGRVVGIDVKPLRVKIPAHARFYLADVMAPDPAVLKETAKGFHVVLSDMAPATTGIKDVDAARSINLCQAAFEMAQNHLVDNGSFVCKILHGEDFKRFSESVKSAFLAFKIYKPQSSRKASREIYLIGMGKRDL